MEVDHLNQPDVGYDSKGAYDHHVGYGWMTPKHDGCRIPAGTMPPPPPKKKRHVYGKKPPPKSGYFNPPDLEVIFQLPTSRQGQACA